MGNFEDLYAPYSDPEDEPEETPVEDLQQAYEDMRKEFEALTLRIARANGAQPDPLAQEPGCPDPAPETGSRSRQAKNCQEKFLPYNTMYKLEARTIYGMEHRLEPRRLLCVNCGAGESMKVVLGCERESGSANNFCPVCEVYSAEFWKDRPHRKVEDAEVR